MPPRNIEDMSGGGETDTLGLDQIEQLVNGATDAAVTAKRPPRQIVWRNVVLFSLLHAGAFYAIFLLPQAMYQTLLWSMFLYFLSAMGITAGAHRLWSHRSYKAKLPLRIFLVFCNCIAFQNSVFEWARDHRAHHKFSETNADPHNAKRGFFFAHIGWLLVKKHPEVKQKGKSVDVSDLTNDPAITFQHRHYLKLVLVLCFIIPTYVPVYMWGESAYIAFYVAALLRYATVLNATWLVNSAAHIWGHRPYDHRINPAENMAVAFCATGEGFHNYHHVFPHDYSTSEFGWHLNLTTLFIDTMARLGLAYDRRKVPLDVIQRRQQRTGILREDKLS
ncbi:acyl-CoA desaturase [Plakobranchus ocellatus]|uniref:Acyl-CoA desaturase n=1 Tax=Plakobranchus ocellatus TaxID=259542 RepID=A0AAV3ZGP9_9GAST|nr:acyl-CoA desaturase [Plakobranchus ocellatus]